MNEGGAFVSTQDTVIALQALATYSAWIKTVVSMVIITRKWRQFCARKKVLHLCRGVVVTG